MPDHRFPEHCTVICDSGCAYFYSDTLLCKFFLPEIQGRGIFPSDKLSALELHPPFQCTLNEARRWSQINEFRIHDVPLVNGNRVLTHWRHLAKDALVIRFRLTAQHWRSLLVSLHEKHPTYKYFHANFKTGAVETVADTRACVIENAFDAFDREITTERVRLSMNWQTGEQTTSTEEVLVTGALISADLMYVMMLDAFRGTLRFDYRNELLQYDSIKQYPSIFDQLPRYFQVQSRTKCKPFLDLSAIADWNRGAYQYFMFLCQKCLRHLRDQIRPYIDKRRRETVKFIPLPQGMQFEVKPLDAVEPMLFSLSNEQHNFPESLWYRPVISFDPFYLFDLLAFDGDMIVRIENERMPVLIEIESIGLKHIIMPRISKQGS